MRFTRRIEQGDLNAAARGLRMVGMSLGQLHALALEHGGKPLFASRVIAAAARQMLAAKRRVGAQP